MPYINAPACVLGECEAPAFPVTTAACSCEIVLGGIGELYIIPCTETLSQANVTDPEWWSGLIADNKLGRMGKGVGSISKGNVFKARTSSCGPEQIINIEWNLNFRELCQDISSARTTQKKYTELITRFSSYLVIARMCSGPETIMPIGKFTATDADYVVPEVIDEAQTVSIVLTWKERGLPETVDVAGLSTVLPMVA